MPRYLGLDWDAHGLRVVAATVKGGKATVEQAVSLAEPLAANADAALAAGKRLKDHLKSAGIAPAPVLVCIGRERAVFRDIRYPDVPAEAPDIIRFQTIKDLTFPAEEAVIDYQASSLGWPSGEKRALAVVVRKDVVSAIKKLCLGAGLKLEGVSVRPFGLAAQRQADTGSTEVAASLVLSNGSGELAVTRGRELLFSRNLAVNGAGPAGLVPELKRSLAAFSGQFPGQDVQRVFVTGLARGSDGEALGQGLRLPIFPYSIGAGEDQSTLYAGALGLLQERAAGKLAINLLSPKQPPPPSNRKRNYVLAGVAAALLLIVGLAVVYGAMSSARTSQVRDLQERKNQLKKQIDGYANMEKTLDAIEAWSGTEVVVLDELYDLIARFPDQPGVRITRASWTTLTVAVAPATTSAKPQTAAKTAPASTAAKPIAQLVLEATSESSESLERLKRALEADVRHWKVSWEKETPGPNQARATLQVFKQPPKEYVSLLSATENKTAPTTGGGDRNRRPGGAGGGSNPFRFGFPSRPEGGRP